MKIHIHPDLRSSARLGVFLAEEVRVLRRQEILWGRFQILSRSVRETARTKNPLENGDLLKVKKFVKAVGLDPERHRTSSELLLRKTLKSLPVLQVNSVVDAANLVSLETMLPVSCYDLARIRGDVELRLGRENEKFDTAARDKFDAAGVPVLSDTPGAFGSMLADSARTTVGSHARRILVVVFGGSAHSDSALKGGMESLAELLSQFSFARVGTHHLVKDEAVLAPGPAVGRV
ncbi:MAG: hypothetical protein HYZ53_17755 [Planctomycetes bacterium]|nr:hypothetical protein [Planctomycetota bacterium]